jgi:hypothetical protein
MTPEQQKQARLAHIRECQAASWWVTREYWIKRCGVWPGVEIDIMRRARDRQARVRRNAARAVSASPGHVSPPDATTSAIGW